MATTYHTAIQELYVAYFNRPADPAGLAHWETVLEGNGGDMAPISAAFAASAEYKDEYDQLTVSGVVTQVYQNLFGRTPDASGLAFWVNALNTNAMTVDTMVTFIANGAQGSDDVAFNSKVVVAKAFTEALNTPAEVAGYNVESLAEAKALIAGIKTAADATAAIVPATLDASVAAVLKSGVEFNLESGLAALGAAQEALADFLEDQEATAAEINAAVDDAEDAVAELVRDPLFGTSTNAGVKAALLAEQEETNADDLEEAQDALADAQEAVEDVDGLGDAIAAATSAAEAVEAAQEALDDATTDAAAAQSELDIRNADLSFAGTLAGGNLVITDGADTVAEIVDGELVLGDDIDAADYTGLAAFIAAGNEYLGAVADLEGATEASMLAQLQVELLDLSAGSLVAGTFTFSATTPVNAAAETYEEILDELSARTAAGTEGAFITQIQNFIAANTTAKADAVIAAEKGTLGLAQAAIAAVDGLEEAIALDEALDAAEAAAAQEVIDLNAAHGAALDIIAGGAVEETVGNVAVATLGVDGKLTAVAGMTTTYPALAAYIAAFNAEVDAQDAYDTAGAGATVAANAGLIGDLAAAEADAASATQADRVEALGTAGAQAAIDDLAEAQDDLEEAEAVADELESLEGAVEEALADFEANDFNEPDVLDSATAFGRTGSDIFVLGDEDTVTITNFGRAGDDVLYIGSGYTLNTGDFADDGDNAKLEVFFVQQGNNTVVTIETETFGSNSGEAEIKITLTGVDAEDLTFTNGIISL